MIFHNCVLCVFKGLFFILTAEKRAFMCFFQRSWGISKPLAIYCLQLATNFLDRLSSTKNQNMFHSLSKWYVCQINKMAAEGSSLTLLENREKRQFSHETWKHLTWFIHSKSYSFSAKYVQLSRWLSVCPVIEIVIFDLDIFCNSWMVIFDLELFGHIFLGLSNMLCNLSVSFCWYRYDFFLSLLKI